MFPVLFLCRVVGFVALVAWAAVPRVASAQVLVRAWLPWNTIETKHFVFHYVDDFGDWTAELASHADAIDSAVARLVGYTPPRRTHVLVHDPYEDPNGSAWPYLDQPLIDVWAAPPSPRDDIGNFRVWGEMLISHEFAHIAHLSRPSRNPFTRRLWQALPVDLGPLTLRTPRWAFEGYATFVEGRVTGSGRPNGAWRAAVLRTWAREGQLPRYEQLDATTGGYEAGSFAYLAGSAFLEWLAREHGDSSLIAVWRRLSARQTRTFDEAFIGVYGEAPATLYQRFAAQVTRLAFEASPASPRVADTGQIVQRLARNTGDPAISPDGRRVALVVRSATLPSRVVVWSTAPEPDTARARRDSLLLMRDPEDVPARSIYPPPKKILESLRSPGGAPYEGPRFLRDGRILLWRNTARGDGSLRPDVYVWDTTSHRVRRITHGASVRDPDPLPEGRSAIATQCLHGWCDVVAVDLGTGAVRIVLRGSPTVSYYRPRVSADGARFVVAANRGDGWGLVIADSSGRGLRWIRDDSVNTYDGDWIDPHTLVAVTERGGVPNVARVELADEHWTHLTNVVGAAVAPVANPADSSIWFLSLYPKGFDLRRRPASAEVAPTPRLATGLEPATPPPPQSTAPFPTNTISSPRPYDISNRQFRWLPAAQYSADGANGGITLVSSDLIARSELLLKAGYGERATWRGATVDFTWRGTWPHLRAQLYGAAQRPSANRAHVAPPNDIDAGLAGIALGIDGAALFDTWQASYRLTATAGGIDELLPLGRGTADGHGFGSLRALAVGEGATAWTQRGDGAALTESMSGSVTGGDTFSHAFSREVASVGIATGGPRLIPLAASAAYGRTDAADQFERFALGGDPSPLVDRALLSQRIAMPVLPTGISIGSSVFTYRVAVPAFTLTPYIWAGSAAGLGQRFASWHRVIGLDWTTAVPHIAVTGTPAARVQLGAGESLDAPLRKRVGAYLSVVLDP